MSPVSRAHIALLCVSAVSMTLSGCSSPSYRQEQIAQAIEGICLNEYGLAISAKQVGGTLAVYLNREEMLEQLGGHVSINPTANETLGNVIEAIHRVALSADKPINFYLLLVSDPATPGIYLTLVRYLEDVRRVNVSDIPPTEFFSRTVLEFKRLDLPMLDFKDVVVHDIRLEQFLTWQMVKRIETRLAQRLQEQGVAVATLGPCLGEFHNGEFAFTLNVLPTPETVLDESTVRQIVEDAASVVAPILSEYRFDRFEGVRFILPATGRNVLLPKSQLKLFR